MDKIPADIPWIEVNTPCIVCGGSRSSLKHVFHFQVLPKPFELRQCNKCGLLFNSPRLADLTPLYRGDYYVFQQPEKLRIENIIYEIKRHFDPCLNIPQRPLDILEIGSAGGHLLHVLRHLGHTVRGVEISRAASKSAREYFNLDIFTGTIGDYVSETTRRQHDIVWCNDVIEHVPDPVGFVRSCATVLKPGGRLILDTPNGGAEPVMQGESDWGGYNPYHIFLFTPDNLVDLCKKAGLRIVAKFTYGNTPSTERTHSTPLKSLLRSGLRTLGILETVRRIRRSAFIHLITSPPVRPISGVEIDRHLSEIPWYSDTPDAHGEYADQCRGNNLVIHAAKE